MNILYIDHYAGSLQMGMEFRPYYFAREWEKLGHHVRIIGASYSHLRKNNPCVKKDFSVEILEGVEYQWVKTISYNGNNVKRALTLFEFCSKLWLNAPKIAQDFRPDAVISSSTYPLDTYPAQRIARLSNAKYVHEAHDLWPLTQIELAGWSEKNPFIQLLAMAEKSAFSKSDAVVGVTAGEAEYMLSHGMQNRDKFMHIPNGVVLADWASPQPLNPEFLEILHQFKQDNKFIICYLGGHAMSNALDTLIDAARIMKNDERFVFVLVGNGAEKPRLQKRAEEEKINNLFFFPPVLKSQVPSLLSYMDALYVGAEPCSLYRFGVSMNKVYDYMMSGKPIIYGVDAANNDVEEAGCGITIRPRNPEDLRNAVIRLFNMSCEERESIGKKGRMWVSHNCEYTLLAQRFLKILS